MKRTLVLILALTVLVTVFAGCGSSSNSTSSGKAISATIASEPKTLDPSLNNSVDGGNYILCGFEGLATIGKDGTIVPGAAEKWEVSSDGLVWTFHIRNGLTAKI
jgi:oligopeptide transport system substrate-binding protein